MKLKEKSLPIRDLSYFFKTKKITWSGESLFLIVGVNKETSLLQEESILKRLLYLLFGVVLIIFIISQFFSRRLVGPLQKLNHFFSELSTKEEIIYLNIDSSREFQSIACVSKLNDYNRNAFEQKKI